MLIHDWDPVLNHFQMRAGVRTNLRAMHAGLASGEWSVAVRSLEARLGIAITVYDADSRLVLQPAQSAHALVTREEQEDCTTAEEEEQMANQSVWAVMAGDVYSSQNLNKALL